MADTKSKKKKGGRPEGAKTEARDVVNVHPSRCKACGSTERGRYTRTKSKAIDGRTPAGDAYNVVTWKRCKCKACGQARVDKVFELSAPKTEDL